MGLLAKTLAKVRGDSEPPADVAKLTAQVALLQDEVESLSSQVKRLEAAQAFDRKLLGKESS